MKGVVALAVLAVVVSAGAARSAPPQRIVFAANHEPTVSGEIWTADAAGHRTDLSRSLAFDGPSFASADGRRVVFASYRGGRAALYLAEHGGVTRLSPYLFDVAPNEGMQLVRGAWDPAGTRFAGVVNGPPNYDHPRLYLAGPGRAWRLLSPATGIDVVGWSPDGRRLAFRRSPGDVAVLGFGASGWDAPGVGGAWSPGGQLAVQENSYTVGVYSADGRRLAHMNGAALAWSSSGALATLTSSGRLQVRPGGVGVPTLDARVPKAQSLHWLGTARLWIGGLQQTGGAIGFDTRTRRTFALPAVYRSFDTVLSADGLQAAATETSGRTVRLRWGSLGGPVRTVATAKACSEESSLVARQIAGGRLLYETGCVDGPADLYSVAPDGSAIRRITTSPLHDQDPSVSPDGRAVAYVQTDNVVHCHGCPYTLLVIPAAGGRARALTEPSEQWPYAFSPSWSPDGSRILFEEAGASDPSRLETVSPHGGPVTDLGIVGSSPVWGPARIAYDAGPNLTLRTANPDGSDVQALAGDAASAGWAPDGRLAYLTGAAHVQLVVVAGSSRRTYAVPGVRRAWPFGRLAWSPDGTRVAFTAYDRDNLSDLWVFTLASHRLVRLTHGLGTVYGVSWR